MYRCIFLSTLLFCQLMAFHSAEAKPITQTGSITVAFSSNKDALSLILRAINEARESIDMAAFSFTSKDISKALVKAHKRGVVVRLVADENVNSKQYTAAFYLANNGIPVRLNGAYVLMHNKFLIIDMKHVQTGSFNYTKAAARKNAENVIFVKDVPDIAKAYANEWEQLWKDGKDFPAKY